MGLHRLDAQKQLLGDRAIGCSGGRKLTHLPLPGRERGHPLGLGAPRSQTGGDQLTAGSLGQQRGAGVIGVRQCQLQRVARLDPASQPGEGVAELEPYP